MWETQESRWRTERATNYSNIVQTISNWKREVVQRNHQTFTRRRQLICISDNHHRNGVQYEKESWL